MSRRTHDSYADADASGESCVVLHHGTGYDTPGEDWVAVDPVMARRLGWTRAERGLFAWRSGDRPMAKSVWWSDGVTEQSMEFWKQCEVAEGWLVVVTEEAVAQLEESIGEMAYVGSWTRTIFLKRGREKYTRTRYFETGWDSV